MLKLKAIALFVFSLILVTLAANASFPDVNELFDDFLATHEAYNGEETMFIDGKYIKVDPNTPAIYQYINAADSNFSWRETNSTFDPDTNCTIYTLNFTSLRWLTDDMVSRSLWSHTLSIVVPQNVTNPGVAGIYITGCTNGSESCPTKETNTYKLLANPIGAPVAILTMIPNSRVIFNDDPLQLERTEDAIVAYTWRHVLEDPSRPDWIVYFPMAKAAHRALQVIEEWSLKKFSQGYLPAPVERHYITGASKRGATTWFLAAYMGEFEPHRVLGAAPLVYDVLNFTRTVESMYMSLGNWTFAFHDYAFEGLIPWFNKPEAAMKPLIKQIDLLQPWYRNGLSKVNKLVLSAIGDEFFLPQNSLFYWDALPEPKQRLQIPDAEHSLATAVLYLLPGVAGNFNALSRPGRVLPKIKSSIDTASQTVVFWANPKPKNVGLFRGLSSPTIPPRRDFRMIKANVEGGCLPPAFPLSEELCGNPIQYKAIELEGIYETKTGYWRYTYTHQEPLPQDQWWAIWTIASWDDGDKVTGAQVYSAPEVMFLPDKYPFESCFGEDKLCPSDTV